MKKLLLSSLVLLSLIGCASTPLPDAYYDKLAGQFIGAQECGAKGFVPAETAAMAIAFTRNKLNEYTYDKAQMQDRLEYAKMSLTVTREQCNSMAVSVMGIKGSQPTAPVQYAPRTTNCATYFGQTHCTTFGVSLPHEKSPQLGAFLWGWRINNRRNCCQPNCMSASFRPHCE